MVIPMRHRSLLAGGADAFFLPNKKACVAIPFFAHMGMATHALNVVQGRYTAYSVVPCSLPEICKKLN